jgi:hypothetical protein
MVRLINMHDAATDTLQSILAYFTQDRYGAVNVTYSSRDVAAATAAYNQRSQNALRPQMKYAHVKNECRLVLQQVCWDCLNYIHMTNRT